jgi:hypothetical protein
LSIYALERTRTFRKIVDIIHTTIDAPFYFSINFGGPGPRASKALLLAVGVPSPIKSNINSEEKGNDEEQSVEQGGNDESHTSIDPF